MELRNIITFQKIAQLGSFSKAADTLGYTQSTVTMQMKQLEAELGLQLFDRIGRKVMVNSDGLRFLDYANVVINETENILTDLGSRDVEPSGQLRIGILESICTAYLPQILSLYHFAYPKVTTIIKIGSLSELSSMLNCGLIDIMWVFDKLIDMPNWICAFSYKSPISIVCAPTHPLANRKDLTLNMVSNEPLILTEQSCSYRNDFISVLTQSGYTPHIFLEIGSTEIIKKFVMQNLGISILPQYTLIEELKARLLTELFLPQYQVAMYGQLFYHKNKRLSLTLKTFIQYVQQFLL